MRSIFTVGINHHKAPLGVREKVVFGPDILDRGLEELKYDVEVPEAAIVSTCNRTEIYCGGGDPKTVLDWFTNFHKIDSREINPYVYLFPEDKAVKHAFRVASGLDSRIIGEPQILGQLKEAVKKAEEVGTLGTVLHKLFQKTFSVAKKVRSQTDIGSTSISLASIALALSEQIFPDMTRRKTLCIGAGEMVELFAARFCERGQKNIVFANRSIEKARELSGKYQGKPISLNDIGLSIHEQDIIFSCTASPRPVIGKGTIESALRTRRHEPIVLFDLAVPRDIEPEVGVLDDIFLYTLDHLGKMANDGSKVRQDAVFEAENIILAGVNEFMKWLGARDYLPTIVSLQERVELQRAMEVEYAKKLLRKGENVEDVLEYLSKSILKKVLHGPISALHESPVPHRSDLAGLLDLIAKNKFKD